MEETKMTALNDPYAAARKKLREMPIEEVARLLLEEQMRQLTPEQEAEMEAKLRDRLVSWTQEEVDNFCEKITNPRLRDLTRRAAPRL